MRTVSHACFSRVTRELHGEFPFLNRITVFFPFPPALKRTGCNRGVSLGVTPKETVTGSPGRRCTGFSSLPAMKSVSFVRFTTQ